MAEKESNGSETPPPTSRKERVGKAKRIRRRAHEIERIHKCPVPGCSKAYGSLGAIKTHMRTKHPLMDKPMRRFPVIYGAPSVATSLARFPTYFPPLPQDPYAALVSLATQKPSGNAAPTIVVQPIVMPIPGKFPIARTPDSPAPTANASAALSSSVLQSTTASSSTTTSSTSSSLQSTTTPIPTMPHATGTVAPPTATSASAFQALTYLYNQGAIFLPPVTCINGISPAGLPASVVVASAMAGGPPAFPALIPPLGMPTLPLFDTRRHQPMALHAHEATPANGTAAASPDVVSTVPIAELGLGDWEYKPSESNPSAKFEAVFDFSKRQLRWELTITDQLQSIVIPFEELGGFGLELHGDDMALLVVELTKPPQVVGAADFTKGRVAKFRRHKLVCPRAQLVPVLRKAMDSDTKLHELFTVGLGELQDAYFEGVEHTDQEGEERLAIKKEKTGGKEEEGGNDTEETGSGSSSEGSDWGEQSS